MVRSKALASTTDRPPSLDSLEVRGRMRTPTRTWEVSVGEGDAVIVGVAFQPSGKQVVVGVCVTWARCCVGG
eukprot:scaffold1557_cov189-Alexandrium_tamarense.AAC.11